MSGVRAYIIAEGQWTKAQKQATRLLIQYSINKQPEYYERAQDLLDIPRALTRARKTLLSENKDITVAKKGFEKAHLDPEDIDAALWIMSNFHELQGLQKAIQIWKKGDQYISKLDSLGRELHQAIQQNQLDTQSRNNFIAQITSVDRALTVREKSFTATLGELSRWMHSFIFWAIISTGMVILIVGYFITNKLFTDISNLNRQLAESETKFKKVLDHSRDVIYQLDFETSKYEYMSPFVEEMLGWPPEAFIEGGRKFVLNRIHPDDLERMEREVEEMAGKNVGDHFAGETEFRIKTKSGDYIWVNNQRSLVYNENGEAVAIVGSVRDISERKKYEVQIERSLQEKQTLLAEIHHRVKNNLAVISSLLELQKKDSNEEAIEVLENTQARIQSIALIHEKLYQTDTFSDINIQEYLDEFIEMVAKTFKTPRKNIRITKELQSFNLDIIKALPLGLIINELLNNAFKHGFADIGEGEIRIRLTEEEGAGKFMVADSGRPLPQDFSLETSQSLGMTLVKTLTKQLDGDIKITQNGWTKFEITFPLSEKRP